MSVDRTISANLSSKGWPDEHLNAVRRRRAPIERESETCALVGEHAVFRKLSETNKDLRDFMSSPMWRQLDRSWESGVNSCCTTCILIPSTIDTLDRAIFNQLSTLRALVGRSSLDPVHPFNHFLDEFCSWWIGGVLAVSSRTRGRPSKLVSTSNPLAVSDRGIRSIRLIEISED